MTSLYLEGDTCGPFPSVSPVLRSQALKSRTTILFGVGRGRNLRRLGAHYQSAPRSPLGATGGIPDGIEYPQGEVYNVIRYLIDI